MPAERSPDRWILLRGLARESGHWLDFPARVREKLGLCYPLDLPGTGKLHKLSSPFRIKDFTEFVRAQKDFLPKGNYFGLAVSLGGMVLSDWISRYPGELKGVVVINTSRGDLSPPHKRLKPEAAAKLLKAMASPSLYERELKILSVLSQREEMHREWAKEWAEIARQRPISPVTVARQLLAAATFGLSNKVSQTPVLVLSSIADEMVDSSCSTQIADQWSCDIERHPWGGHDLTLDDPDWVLEKTSQWRQKLKSAGI
jgi:pimeloyl-[acyl-carrier protein] methyl ester esterase